MIIRFGMHTTVFSAETKPPYSFDRQVVVNAPHTHATIGIQGIKRVAGLHNALLDDDPEARLFNADGPSRHFALGQWQATDGQVVPHVGVMEAEIHGYFVQLIPMDDTAYSRTTLIVGWLARCRVTAQEWTIMPSHILRSTSFLMQK
ncbi:hypothetical protein OVY01_03170 [Robbsia sp. Bb-Pol-6]|uniref:Uncharacterized protein n=1 Tax=Robbsia betulipollinis TaxID=2981849 RepID=A0ABT3ZIA5_9BURK|nr:hypothetical protein [Robbsia betulipollinis]MCY0386264.1 hypothetical protein [Robbsia betulipollinis]